MVREMDFVDECYADKDLSLLKKLTLIIPTYNRNYYLSRCLWYHAHFPFGQIIVADSSPEEKKVVNRETVAKVREMFGADILYLEYEPETEKYGGDIYRKWGDAVMHVETEYVQICTDKAFRIPTGFTDAITFLSLNKDYVASKPGTGHYITSKSPSPLISQTLSVSEVMREPLDGFLDSLCNVGWANSTMFAVYRTRTLKEIFLPIVNLKINDIRYGEFHIGYSGYLLGKVHIDNINPFIIRDVSRVPSDKPNSESSTTRYHPIHSYRYLLTSKGKLTYENYKSELIRLISTHSHDNVETIAKMIDGYIRPTLFIKYFNFPDNKILYSLLMKLPLLSLGYPIVKKILDFWRDNLNTQKSITMNQIVGEVKTDETKIISQIVSNTSSLYNDDKPVI